MCFDTEGSYCCVCAVGYYPTSVECGNTSLICDGNRLSVYNLSYMVCLSPCIDIDECAQNETSTCDTMNGYCNNTQGSYECLCNFGYSSNTTMNNTCSKFMSHFLSSPPKISRDHSHNYFSVSVTGCEDGQVVLLSDSQPPSVDHTEGRVEVCINNSYTAVCDDLWDELEALIICRQLGFNVSICECYSQYNEGFGINPTFNVAI